MIISIAFFYKEKENSRLNILKLLEMINSMRENFRDFKSFIIITKRLKTFMFDNLRSSYSYYYFFKKKQEVHINFLRANYNISPTV